VRTKKITTIPVASPVFLVSAEVRDTLRCSKRTLLRMVHGYYRDDGTRVRAVLPFIRRGSRLLFAKSAVESYITKRTVQA
jgi:hypothetical protein